MSQDAIEILTLEICAVEAERLGLDRASRKLKTQEDNLRASLIKVMQDYGLTTLETELTYAHISVNVDPVILSWEELEEYIRANNAVDLLQKRLTPTAVKLRWDDGIQIPGVGIKTVNKVTTKLRNQHE